MKAVWKFPLKPTADTRGLVEISMPVGAQPLTVSANTGEPCLWALVNPYAGTETRRFIIAGTGHGSEVDFDREHYVGTFFTSCDMVGRVMGMPPVLVFHVFEVKP